MVQPCGHNLQPTSTPHPTCTPHPNLTLSNSRPMAGAGAPVQGHPRRVRGQLRPSATLAAAHRHRAARHAQRRPGALQHPRWGGGAPACTLHSWGGRMLCTAPCSAHVSRSVLGVMDCSAQRALPGAPSNCAGLPSKGLGGPFPSGCRACLPLLLPCAPGRPPVSPLLAANLKALPDRVAQWCVAACTLQRREEAEAKALAQAQGEPPPPCKYLAEVRLQLKVGGGQGVVTACMCVCTRVRVQRKALFCVSVCGGEGGVRKACHRCSK